MFGSNLDVERTEKPVFSSHEPDYSSVLQHPDYVSTPYTDFFMQKGNAKLC